MAAIEVNHRKYTETFLKHSKLVVLISIAIYTIIFSIVTILRYYSFQTYAYDLGIYNQALHNPFYNGQLFYNTADLLANPTGNLFGIHSSPILFLILPFYQLFSAPPTLLVIQSFALALGALPLYLLSSKMLKSEKWGLTLAILYLINPALQGVNWYDFHPEAFLPVLILFAIYFYEIKRPSLFLVFVILTLSCIEFSALLLVFLAFYFIIALKPWKRDTIDKTKLKMAVATIFLSFVWFFISIQIMHAINPLVRPMSGETFWGQVGANSILDIPLQAITNPGRVIQALTFDGSFKLVYLLVLLGSVAFLPIFEPLIAICLAPWLITCFVSNYQPFYQFGDQYPAYIIAFLFYGAIVGLVNIHSHKSRIIKNRTRIIGVLLFVPIVLFFLFTPLSANPYQSVGAFQYGLPEISEHDQSVLDMLSFIPSNGSVMAQNSIFPHLSNRPNVYVFPAGVFYPPGETFPDVLNSMLTKADFLVGDLKTDDVVLPTFFHYAMDNGYGVYAAADGAVLLKRGYSDQPVFFQPIKESFSPDSFILVEGSKVKDPDSMNGVAFLHSNMNKNVDLFWVGPYVLLNPGEYEAIFSLKVDNIPVSDVLDLHVSLFIYKETINYIGTNNTGHSLRFVISTDGEQKVQSSLRVNGMDFNQTGKYQDFTVKFNVTDFGAYEFRGTSISNSTNIYFNGVHLIQTKPSGNLYFEIQEKYPGSSK